jgi:glycosyltransferase involved in cell wall biosynthesis
LTTALIEVSSPRTPTIAAIILNYNYAQYVVDAIESVLAQDLPFDEILVVDDGSKDRSLDVINAFQPRVRVLAKENGGQLSACLAGVRAVSADYVYVLDADDYAAADLVSSVKPLLGTGAVKIQFQLMGVDANKSRLGGVFPTYAEGYDSMKMTEDNRVMGFYMCPPTSGNIFRRETLVNMNLARIDLRDFVDGPPALAIPYLGSVTSLNKPLAYYRVHGSGHSRWDRPDVRLLQTEIDWFGRRWANACELLGLKEPPFGKDEPLYILERKLMQAALLGRANVFGGSVRYIRRLLTAHVPTSQKLMLGVWALGLLLPIPKWRSKLVLARRSPLNRPQGLSRMVRWLLQYRKGRTASAAVLSR